jgi:hypothetical protein
MSDEEKFIGPVRFTFEEPPKNKRDERVIAGTKYSGMIVDVSRKGIEISGYYSGIREDIRYRNLKEPVVFPWEELDKLRERINRPPNKRKAILDRRESDVDEEYLETLPVVTINSRKYYVDPVLRERRAVQKPYEVWKF